MLRGFAGLKFSGSPIIIGLIEEINIIDTTSAIAVIISFVEKYGWNGVLSMFGFMPLGWLDPV